MKKISLRYTRAAVYMQTYHADAFPST